MPSVPVKTRTGTVYFSYTISTPNETSAKTIVPALPTVLFIHPAYFSSLVYHAQFGDRRLRRFNLVAFDLRCIGFTTGARVRTPYTPDEVAEDVAKFMDAIDLPPCHIVALGTGTSIAFDLALEYSQKCLSLCLLSPLGFPEYNPAIEEGVAQIHELWKEAMANPVNIDKSMIWDALSGIRQFGFSYMSGSKLGNAMFQVWFARSLEIWGPDPKAIEEFFETTLGFFSHEQPLARTANQLKGISVPVKLIQGTNNLINNRPAEYLGKFGELFQEAGVKFEAALIPYAPHCLCVDYSEQLNPLIHDFILKSTRVPAPPPPSQATSPWENLLRAAGYESEDDVDDELIIHRYPLHSSGINGCNAKWPRSLIDEYTP
ncbi:alpha/beta-hydrolase [Marasmius fiardii PR-910]|nr:alpha/beta-hydrolase [Marasmius fiardii PR-910]